MVLVYILTLGVYWWDPCYHRKSSTMDPSWVFVGPMIFEPTWWNFWAPNPITTLRRCIFGRNATHKAYSFGIRYPLMDRSPSFLAKLSKSLKKWLVFGWSNPKSRCCWNHQILPFLRKTPMFPTSILIFHGFFHGFSHPPWHPRSIPPWHASICCCAVLGSEFSVSNSSMVPWKPSAEAPLSPRM